jgi:hypothetical protein
MSVDGDLQRRPPMPILITVEGLGVPLALKQTSCALQVMGILPNTGDSQ